MFIVKGLVKKDLSLYMNITITLSPLLSPSPSFPLVHMYFISPLLLPSGYMLEPKSESRPTIWQVCEVAFSLMGRRNPVQNVFVSHIIKPIHYRVLDSIIELPDVQMSAQSDCNSSWQIFHYFG